MKMRYLILLAVFGLYSLPATASATFTYSGFVVAGYDQTGIFGTPETSLTGDAFTLAIFSNSPQISTSAGVPYELLGPLSATLTITGNSYTIPLQSSDYTFVSGLPGSFTDFGVGSADGQSVVDFSAFGSASPDNPNNSFSYDLGLPSFPLILGGGGSGGIFHDCSGSVANGGYCNYAYLQSAFYGNAGPLAPLGEEPGGVPEPSTWAMMLVGFAGLGLAGSRLRSA
jgi:hypothetical protein